MKAAVLVEHCAPIVVTDIDLPEKFSFGQVLVKVRYSAVCGAQVNEIDGVKGPDKFLPHLLGHEGSGVVEEIGEGVKTVAKGDHVVMHWRPGGGLQSETPVYRWRNERVNAGWVTTFNEYAVVSENRLTAIPTDFDLKLATLFGCAVTTAFGVINNDAQVKVGQSVVIFGMGGVGLAVARAAEMTSAYPIIGVDQHNSKMTLAQKLGVTHFFDSNATPDLRTEIYRIIGEDGADVVIDTTGSARVIELAYELTHPAGRTVLVGVPREGDNVSIYTLPLHFNKILVGSHGGGTEPHVDIPRYIRLVQAGRLKLDGLITHEFGLEGINEAIEVMRSGEAGRCLIVIP